MHEKENESENENLNECKPLVGITQGVWLPPFVVIFELEIVFSSSPPPRPRVRLAYLCNGEMHTFPFSVVDIDACLDASFAQWTFVWVLCQDGETNRAEAEYFREFHEVDAVVSSGIWFFVNSKK